jgi:hypothetical protein
LDDFGVDAEGGGVVDEVLAVTAIGPHLAQAVVVDGHLLDRVRPAVESWTPAAVTSTAISRPRVSVTMLRLHPTVFLPASMPCLLAETEVEVFTL